MIQYHGFYPWHREDLLNERDMLAALQEFSAHDLNSKNDNP